MTNIRFPVLVFLALVFLCPVLPASAQVTVPESSYAPQAADARTRARLHTELASAYFQSGVFAVALEEIGIAIEADPTYASAYSVRALINASLQEAVSAEADFKKALSLAPNDPDVNNNYGWYLCQQNRTRESIAYFLTALKNPLYSTPEIAYTNAGECAMKLGDLNAARNYLYQALRAGPNMQAQFYLANLAYREGNLQEARNRLMEIMQVTTTLPPAALWLGIRLERKLGNKAEENSLTTQLRRLYPGSLEYQELLKGNYD